MKSEDIKTAGDLADFLSQIKFEYEGVELSLEYFVKAKHASSQIRGDKLYLLDDDEIKITHIPEIEKEEKQEHKIIPLLVDSGKRKESSKKYNIKADSFTVSVSPKPSGLPKELAWNLEEYSVEMTEDQIWSLIAEFLLVKEYRVPKEYFNNVSFDGKKRSFTFEISGNHPFVHDISNQEQMVWRDV